MDRINCKMRVKAGKAGAPPDGPHNHQVKGLHFMEAWGGGREGQEQEGNMASWAGVQSSLSALEMGSVAPSSNTVSECH